MTLSKLFLTFFGTGAIPKFPHLAARLLALVSGAVVLYTMGMQSLFMLILAASTIAIFEINEHGSSNVSIDQAIGMWLALLVPYSTTLTLTYPYVEWIAIAVSFASFCLFMDWGPSTIGWIKQNVKGGLGVIGSAVLAGFAAGFLTLLILLGIGKLF